MTEPFAMVPVALISNPQIHDSAIRVYARLAASVNSSDSVSAAWPSTRSLAKDLGMSQRTAQRAIIDLKTQGWLTEIPESQWLPRWHTVLADRVQTVRVFGLPRHPKRDAQTTQTKTRRNTRKARAEQAAKDTLRERRAFHEEALRELLDTGTYPNRAMGRNMNIDLAVNRGEVTDEASMIALLDKTFRPR